MNDTPRQSVKLRHHKHIALAHELQGGVQLGPFQGYG